VSRNQPTFSEIRTEVRRNLDDLNAGIWTDAELNRNINRAILRTWVDSEWETKQSTITGQTNSSWYLLPTDCLVPKVLIAASWSNEKMFPTDLIRMDKFDSGWEGEPNSIPSRFLVYSYDRFYIWPPVNANAGARNFTLEYVPVPSTVTSDSSTTLGSSSAVPPLFISDLIPLKATALSWMRQDWQKAREYNQLYQGAVMEAGVTLRNLSGAFPSKLRPADKFDKSHGAMRFKLRL